MGCCFHCTRNGGFRVCPRIFEKPGSRRLARRGARVEQPSPRGAPAAVVRTAIRRSPDGEGAMERDPRGGYGDSRNLSDDTYRWSRVASSSKMMQGSVCLVRSAEFRWMVRDGRRWLSLNVIKLTNSA